MKKLLFAISIVTCWDVAFAQKASTINVADNASTLACSTAYLTVDIQKVFQNYDKARIAQEKLQASADRAQQEMNVMVEAGRQMVTGLQELRDKANNPAFNDEARNKYSSEADDAEMQIRQKERELNEFRMQTERTLNQQNATLVEVSMQEIQVVLKKIAQERSADLVLNSSGPFVVYSDAKLDVTDLTLSRLNIDKPKASQSANTKSNTKSTGK